MAHDPKKLLFFSKIYSIGEDEFAAGFPGTEGELLMEKMYGEFLDQGSPRDVKSWLRVRLAKDFLYLENLPKWIEDTCAWPFFEGRPMVFIHQFSVSETPFSEKEIAPGVELYIFGIRKTVANGWQMHYLTVEQHYCFAV